MTFRPVPYSVQSPSFLAFPARIAQLMSDLQSVLFPLPASPTTSTRGPNVSSGCKCSGKARIGSLKGKKEGGG